MVKRNKIVAILMAGLMAVLPISQSVSIYASESDTEIVTQEEQPVVSEESSTGEDLQSEPEVGPESTDDSVGAEEPSSSQTDTASDYVASSDNDSDGNSSSDSSSAYNENSGESSNEDIFSDGSTDDLNVSDTEEKSATLQSLQWTGKIGDIDITANLSCENGSEMDASDVLDVKETEKEAKKELETKISAMAVSSCASVKFGFNISRKDENGEEKEKNASYKISLSMADVSTLKRLKLYHKKENGDMEELTFTSGSNKDGGQQIEFVSATGLGNFAFIEIDKTEMTNGGTDEFEDTASDMTEDLTVNAAGTKSMTENTSEEPRAAEQVAEEAAENSTQTNQDEDTTAKIVPVNISEFQVSLVNGADESNGKNVWNPSDPAKGHSFIYRVNYTMSGTFSTDTGAFKIELPLHILKDKDGNWADAFNCPYWTRSEVTEGDNPDFVYEIDEENNKVTIYNYRPYPTGEAGYVEFSYETTKDTMQYLDMGASTKVHAKVYATNQASTVTKEAEADEVYIDTHATIAYTQKKKPTLYKEWDEAWGERPADADNYYYLVWPIRSYVNKNTSSYDFYYK